jgi:hypothetical protein
LDVRNIVDYKDLFNSLEGVVKDYNTSRPMLCPTATSTE